MTTPPLRSVCSFFPHRSPREPLTLGAVLAAARKAEGWSLIQCGAAIGTQRDSGKPVSPQFLNDVEHDRRRPSEALLVAMATVFHLDADELRAVGRLPFGTIENYLHRFPDQAPAVLRFFTHAQQRGVPDWEQLTAMLAQTDRGRPAGEGGGVISHDA